MSSSAIAGAGIIALLLLAHSLAHSKSRSADLNRDGQPDIVVGWVNEPGSVYYNTGRGHSFHEVPWNDGKSVVYSMSFADFNGDGWPDIVAARSDAPNAIWFSTPPASGR